MAEWGVKERVWWDLYQYSPQESLCEILLNSYSSTVYKGAFITC